MPKPAAISAPTREPLAPSQLRWVCDPSAYPCLDGEGRCGPLQSVGQRRAVDAITLGLAVNAPGYNIFATGLTGSGRTHTIVSLLEQLPTPLRRTVDRAFVHNFSDPYRPRLLTFPSGRARAFADAMHELTESVPGELRKTFEDPSYRDKRGAITGPFEERAKELLVELERSVSADDLTIIALQSESMTVQTIVPLVDGKPIPFEILRRTSTQPKEEIDALERKAEAHRVRLDATLAEGRRLRRDAHRAVKTFDKTVARDALECLVHDVAEAFPDDDVRAYLDEVLEALCDGALGLRALAENEDISLDDTIFSVNVIQDEIEGDDAPVIIEAHPSFTNLFGWIERDRSADASHQTPGFTGIRGGSLLRADGGFLVMYARDVLSEPGVWSTLSRVLRSRQLDLQNPETALYMIPSSVKPDPIPIDVKVILIGSARLHALLSEYDADFAKIFKVKAEFDGSVERTGDAVEQFADVARGLAERDGLLPITADALAALVEEAVRQAGRRNRLSVRFGEIADVIREADHLCRRAAPPLPKIDAASVRRALSGRLDRQALVDDKITDAMIDDVIRVETGGERIGQINGLAVYGWGGARFGKPTRITATVGIGRGGLINIEREAKLSGPSHDKGVLILAGYLRHRYGHSDPIVLRASLAFEQSYGGVDGDSASLAELYALLSALSGVPIRQSIAITGSLDQLGNAQAIGGVNDKIEGFFRLCDLRGLDGTHGCIIPTANVLDLMLEQPVVAASAEGKFSVWAIDSADDAIPVLFGVEAEALHAKVRLRLAALAETATKDDEA